MPDDIDQLKPAFGKAVLARDHEALDVILAPWITVATALEKFQVCIREMLDEWEIAEDAWPTDFDAGGGLMSYEDLRQESDFPPGVDIPEQVTADNYVGWHNLTFYPDEEAEFDAYCDAWFAVVKLPDGLHVGSLELVDPD
ncbi:MAG: hypothetical protein ACRDKI_11745 [Solirubrobacterales bacterium]